MEKIVIHRRGHYDALRLERHPGPTPGPGEVRIAVEAAGVNYADCVVRMGLYKSAHKFVGWPITPGFEVAGTVASVGEGVDDLAYGSRVMAVTRFGGYATEVVVPRNQVFDVPPGWSIEAAAGFLAVNLTAYYALCELVRPRRGARLLVHSAAGGVGGALVQLGRHLGCDVTGVVGASAKVDTARAMGAHAVIDKSSESLWPTAKGYAPTGFDAVFDANGVETLRHSFDHLAAAGRLVVYGFATMLPRGGRKPNWLRLAWHWLRTPRFDPLALTDTNRSVMGFNLSFMFDHTAVLARAMGALGDWAATGVLRPPPLTVYPLAAAGDAHRALETGQTLGKLVLRTGGGGKTGS